MKIHSFKSPKNIGRDAKLGKNNTKGIMLNSSCIYLLLI